MFPSCCGHQTIGGDARIGSDGLVVIRDQSHEMRCLSKSFTDRTEVQGRQAGLASTGSDQAYRAISTGQLNALLRLHLRPIDVVVYHGPQGYLVLRGASRLDAFSGYPVRS